MSVWRRVAERERERGEDYMQIRPDDLLEIVDTLDCLEAALRPLASWLPVGSEPYDVTPSHPEAKELRARIFFAKNVLEGASHLEGERE